MYLTQPLYLTFHFTLFGGVRLQLLAILSYGLEYGNFHTVLGYLPNCKAEEKRCLRHGEHILYDGRHTTIVRLLQALSINHDTVDNGISRHSWRPECSM